MTLNSLGKLVVAVPLMFFLASSLAHAEEKTPDTPKKLDEMSLDELLDVKVSVATRTETTARTTPGIVTVITAEEIANMGARDLTDVLLQVPGFSLAYDVEGVTSIGVRGNWAEEGKALLLWDGEEMNEGLYGNLPLGNRFPVDQIQKIEIIRGPGSAIYGGFAELAVIKVTTKGAADLNGQQIHGLYTQMGSGYGRGDIDFSVGKKFDDFEFSMMGFFGQMRRSDANYTDANGNTYNLADNAQTNPEMFDLGIKYKGLEIRGLVDRYHTTDQSAYGVNLSAPVNVDFDSYFLNVKYTAKLADNMTITPFVDLKYQWPWMTTEPVPVIFEQQSIAFEVRYARYKEGLIHSWDILPTLNLQTGLEFYQEEADIENYWTFQNSPSGHYEFNDRVVYSQGVWTNDIVNVTLGARVDNQNIYGTSFVPRLGLTKQLSDWNFKFLLSRAYRAPTAMDIDSNPNIQPEQTTVTELEAGYRVTDDLFTTLNLYNIAISNPIIYAYDPGSNSDLYKNYDTAGTRGLEFEVKAKNKWGYINASYSYFVPVTSGIVSYSVPGADNSLLGMPNHKLAITSHFSTPIRNLKFSPSLVWFSNQWAYTGVDSNGNPLLSKLSPITLINLYAYYDDFLVKRLRLGVGVNNLLASDFPVAQPYSLPSDEIGTATPHPPMAAPGSSREAMLKLSYEMPI